MSEWKSEYFTSLWNSERGKFDDVALKKKVKEYINIKIQPGFSTYAYLVGNYSNGQILHLSDKCQQLFGYSNEFFREKNNGAFLKMIPESDRKLSLSASACVWPFVHSFPEHERIGSSIIWESTFTKSNNENIRCVNQNITLMLDDNGIALLTLSLYIDISNLYTDFSELKPKLHYYHKPGNTTYHFDHDKQQFYSKDDLSKREREVAKLYARNFTSKEIADRLHISYYTVQSHRSNIMKKLDCKTKEEMLGMIITYQLF